MRRYLIYWLGGLLCAVVALIAAAWAFGAVWFDGPFGAGNKLAAALLVIAFMVVLIFVRPFWRKLGIFVALFAGVLIWWLTLSPTNEATGNRTWRSWRGPTFKAMKSHSTTSATATTGPRWTTPRIGKPAPCASRRSPASTSRSITGARPGSRIPSSAFNSLTRRRSVSPSRCARSSAKATRPIGGLYRQFELIYIVADERDVIRLRTNYRKERYLSLSHNDFAGAGARTFP